MKNGGKNKQKTKKKMHFDLVARVPRLCPQDTTL